METPESQRLSFSQLENIGMIVGDLDGAVAHFESFGIGPFGRLDSHPFGETLNPSAVGMQSSRLEAKRARLGSAGIELVKPSGGDSLWTEFLARGGDGVMYLTFAVDDIDRGEASLVGKGFKLIHSSRFQQGGGAAFFDTRKFGGVIMGIVKPPSGRDGGSASPPPFSNLHHIGFVVRDLDAAVQYFESLGFGPFKPLRLIGDRFEQTQYGVPTKYRLKNAGTHIGQTKIEFEFLQPLENAPLQENFLSKRGEGVNHLGFKVGLVEAETSKMQEKGFDVVLTVKFTSGTICKYLDTSKIGGEMVEFWQLPTATV